MFDRYDDVLQRLDRQLLTRKEPPSFVHAKELLRRKGIRAKEIHWTDPDSIGYLDTDDQPWTAWCHRAPNGIVYVERERGFAALPGYIEPESDPAIDRAAEVPYDRGDDDSYDPA
jgi:hypothetical protein